MTDGLLSRYTKQVKAVNGEAKTGRADHDRTRRARPRLRPKRLGVLILRQGQEADREGAFELRQDRMTIGRSRENDIVLEDHGASRVHAVVTRDEEGSYRIRDEDSTNGTYVNSQRISEHVLADDDEIRIGMTELAFRHQE